MRHLNIVVCLLIYAILPPRTIITLTPSSKRFGKLCIKYSEDHSKFARHKRSAKHRIRFGGGETMWEKADCFLSFAYCTLRFPLGNLKRFLWKLPEIKQLGGN